MWGEPALIAVASAAAEPGLQGVRASVVAAPGSSPGSVAVAHGLSCSGHAGASRTRDQTGVPYIGRQIPNHSTIRKVSVLNFC